MIAASILLVLTSAHLNAEGFTNQGVRTAGAFRAVIFHAR
jgi:hypothetical protein